MPICCVARIRDRKQIQKIAELLSQVRFTFGNEKTFQDQIAQVLADAGYDLRREVKLSDAERVDFMLGSIALELKLKGSEDVHLRQLQRYARIEAVTAVCLVSPKVRYLPKELAGKPVFGIAVCRL